MLDYLRALVAGSFNEISIDNTVKPVCYGIISFRCYVYYLPHTV